jgi:hypothetical protein
MFTIMAKIQVSTVTKQANVQVIELNAYTITKIVKAQIRLKDALKNAEHKKREYKVVDDETGEKAWVNVLDENGNEIVEYSNVDGSMLNNEVMPLLQELVDALEGESE